MGFKYHPDMTMETNKWRINNPLFTDENAPKWRCTDDSHWTGIYGTDFFLNSNSKGNRVWFSYFCKEEHFYYLWWSSLHDIIFASYDLNEVIRFAKKLITTKDWLRHLYVQDAITRQYYAFVTDDVPDTWYFHTRAFKNCCPISLGNHKFINE